MSASDHEFTLTGTTCLSSSPLAARMAKGGRESRGFRQDRDGYTHRAVSLAIVVVRVEAIENETCEHIDYCFEFDVVAIVMSRCAI